MYVTTCVPGVCGCQKGVPAPGTAVTDDRTSMWVMGTEPRSSARAASARNLLSHLSSLHFTFFGKDYIVELSDAT